MLRDTTGLTGNDVGLADVVQQGGFTVVNVTHNRDDRMTRYQIFGIVLSILAACLFCISTDKLNLEAELLCQQRNRLRIQSLVDGHE